MASQDDQKLIEEVTEILSRDGLSEPENRVLTAMKAYADAPKSPARDLTNEEQEVRDSVGSLFHLSGVLTQKQLLELSERIKLGTAGSVTGVNGVGVPEAQEAADYAFSRFLRAITAQAIQAEAMREFNEAMDELDKGLKTFGKGVDDWAAGKQTILEKKIQDWETVEKFQSLEREQLEDLRISAKDHSPAGQTKVDRQIDTAIETHVKHKAHLQSMKAMLEQEHANDERFMVEYSYRKAEMIAGFERRIEDVKDEQTRTLFQEGINELKKDKPDFDKIAKIKTQAEDHLKTLPEGSPERVKIERMLKAGDGLLVPIKKAAIELENYQKQKFRVDELIQQETEQIKMLEEAKNLSPSEKERKIVEIQDRFEAQIKEAIGNNVTSRDIINSLEKQRLEIASKKANEAVLKGGLTSMSSLKDTFLANVLGGKKRTLTNGETVEIFQGHENYLYYEIKNGKRVYLSGEDQFKFLNEDGYTPERLKAERLKAESLKKAGTSSEYQDNLANYKPGDTTPALPKDFASATNALPIEKPIPVAALELSPTPLA